MDQFTEVKHKHIRYFISAVQCPNINFSAINKLSKAIMSGLDWETVEEMNTTCFDMAEAGAFYGGDDGEFDFVAF